MKRLIIFILATCIIVLNGCNNIPKLNKLQKVVKQDDGTYISKYGQINIDEWEKLDFEGNRFKSPEEFFE